MAGRRSKRNEFGDMTRTLYHRVDPRRVSRAQDSRERGCVFAAMPEPSGTVLQMVDAGPVKGQKSRILITVVGRLRPRPATETWSLREVDCIARRYRMH